MSGEREKPEEYAVRGPNCAACGAFNLGKKPRGCYCANWQETFRFHEAMRNSGYEVRLEAKGHEVAGPRR